MRADFQLWLQQQGVESGLITQQLNRANRVEKQYGSLDKHYTRDRLESIIGEFQYSPEDEKKRKPNPSKLTFEGNIRNNLSLFRYAVEQYRRFRDTEMDMAGRAVAEDDDSSMGAGAGADEDVRQRTGLERDMQAALRADITQLEQDLKIIDGGVERIVESGSIPITARDASGAIVIIDLKAASVSRRAVAQVLSHMGDIAADEPDSAVRGILVAPSFDSRGRAAARMAPSLSLRAFATRFEFFPVED